VFLGDADRDRRRDHDLATVGGRSLFSLVAPLALPALLDRSPGPVRVGPGLGDGDGVQCVGAERRVRSVLFRAADRKERDVDVGVPDVGPSDLAEAHTDTSAPAAV
jgi:hypothetical protein